MRAILLLTASLVAACQPNAVQPTAPPKAAVGPEIVVRFSKSGQQAKDLLELVAAQCWLDGIVRGAQMIVDRNTGRVIIVGDTDDLLAADFLRPLDGRSRIRLSGPVVADPVKADRLVQSLDRAVKTGQTSCPIATG
ncbi:MAG: hypothetical protein AAGB15_11215 [Pseudomonadota bacterium]